MNKKFIILLLMIIFVTTGCGKKEKIKIESVRDYYISNYSAELEGRYATAYAAYLYTHPSGDIEGFKEGYEEGKTYYEFKDLNGDGIEEFIVIIDNSKSTDNFKQPKSITIYKIDNKTKKVSYYLTGEYWDTLYYNKSKDIYLSKYNYDDTFTNLPEGVSTNTIVYSIMELYDDMDYYMYLNYMRHNTLNDTYLYSSKHNEIFTRYELQDGNISREEGRKYLDGIEEIKLDLHNLSDIFTKTYEDSILESVDRKLKKRTDTNDKNLKCTSSDVDKIIKYLEQGKTVKVDMDGDIKVSKSEGNQFYNKQYPYFTEYYISCGSYSRTIRVSHK